MVKKYRPEQTRRRHDLLSDLAESVTYELVRFGMTAEQATQAGETVALRVHDNWRGMSVVFPMWPELARRRLRLAIIAEYTGANIRDLVRKYHIAENTIHQWIAEERRRRIDESQQGLFDDADPESGESSMPDGDKTED